MNRQIVNYETLLKVTRAMSMSKDPHEVIKLTVDSIRSAMNIKGCAFFLINKENNVLEIAASSGLSDSYLNKGVVSASLSIEQSLEEGPVAIYDVNDDPRIQYPEAAQAEGISSILSVPVYLAGNVIGAMRVYSAEKWEFSLDDVNFVTALAQIAGILMDMCRLHKGQNELIDVLSAMCESPAM